MSASLDVCTLRRVSEFYGNGGENIEPLSVTMHNEANIVSKRQSKRDEMEDLIKWPEGRFTVPHMHGAESSSRYRAQKNWLSGAAGHPNNG